MSTSFLKSLLKYGSQPIKRIKGRKMQIVAVLILSTLLFKCALGEDYDPVYPNYDYEGYTPYCPSVCTCTEVEFDCSNAQLSSIPGISNPNVQRIVLKENLLSSIDSITSSASSVLYIDASSNLISSVDWSSFSSLTTLRELYLQTNKIFWVDASQFHASNLLILNVSVNKLLSIQFGDNADLPLQELYIENCDLLSLNPGASNSLCQLQILHAGGNNIGNLPSGFLDCMSNLRELKLNDMGLTALSADTFTSAPSLQTLDLSRNMLTWLPDGIFSNLNDLQFLKLSGNPWSCDCSLMPLKIFMDSFIASGGIIQDESLTFCSSYEEVPPRITAVSSYDISGCTDAEMRQRVVRSVQTNTSPIDWGASCPKWQSSHHGLSCGPSLVASCVYSHDNRSYAIAQYSTSVSGPASQSDCRDKCAQNDFTYFAFESTHQQCLCGDIDWSLHCSDCPFFITPAAVTTHLCNWQFSNLQGAQNVMHDLEISTSQVLEINSLIEFSVSGGLTDFDSFSWNFGDGDNISTVVKDRNVSHRYIYPGEFNVTVSMTSYNYASVNIVRSIKIKVVTSQEEGDISCPSTTVSTFSHLSVNAKFSSSWSQSVTWKRELVSQSQPPVTYEYYDKECDSGWTLFGNRCFQALSSNWAMSSAQAECVTLGGQLMRLYSDVEVAELVTIPEFFTQQSANTYLTGAEWSSSSKRYFWKDSTSSVQAYINRAKLSPESNENCVVVDKDGLKAADCSLQYLAICEKDTVECLTKSTRKTCYVSVQHQVSWDEASAWCRANYTNGRLATVTNYAENNLVQRMLFQKSNAWIGLTADTMEGYYRWSSGESVDGYSNWEDKGQEPCVIANSQGQWETKECSETNGFICEYYVGDEINVRYQVAGLPVQSVVDVTPMSIASTSTPMGLSSLITVLLPGSWISENGTLKVWHLQVQNSSQDQMTSLHLWRPVCSSGKTLDPPGCNNAKPHYTCVTTQTNDCSSSSCQDGFYYCPLTQACHAISQPCTCSGAHQILNNIDCNNIGFNSLDPVYELVHKATVTIPAGNTVVDFADDFRVVKGDIIGWQAQSKDILQCDGASSSPSKWSQVSLSTSQNIELNLGHLLDPQSLSLEQNVECRISVVFTSGKEISTTTSLAYLSQPGEYTYYIESSNSASPPSCVVTAQDSIEGLLWVYPTPKSVTYSTSGSQKVEIELLQGKPYTFVVALLKGSDPQITWTIHQGSAVTPTMSASCPSSISPLPEICQQYLSSLSKPYSSNLATFSSSLTNQSIFVNAFNGISTESLTVSVNVVVPVTGLTLTHDSCQGIQMSCDVTVEVGVATTFSISVEAGEVSQTLYYKDGTLLNVGGLNLSTIDHTFTQPGKYLLLVNASNALSYMMANVTVYARIPANFQNLIFVDVPTTVAQQDAVDIKASAEVALRSYYTVTWSIGKDNSTFITESTTRTHLDLSLPSQIFKDTGNVTVSVYLEDAFGYNMSLSAIVNVYRRIEKVFLLINPNIASLSEPFTMTINVDNSTAIYQPFYGLLNFTLVSDTANYTMSMTNTLIEQSLNHNISVVGIYTFTISVYSEFEINNVVTSTTDVDIRESISGLSLTYDGPKHVSNELTFVAAATRGTSVEYSLKFGDGNEMPFQTSETFKHTYANASVYQATLTADNGISSKRSRLTLYAYDQNLLEIIRIHGKNCLASNTSAEMLAEIAAEDPLSLVYSWDFGNGTSRTGTGDKSVTIGYTNIGDYWVKFSVTNPVNGKRVNETKHICVEEKISGLSVDFPSLVALDHQKGYAEIKFVATVQSGSNISFTWDSGAVPHNKDYDTMSMNVTSIGEKTVTIRVSNDVGRIRRTLHFTVMEVISDINMTCLTCLSNIYTPTGNNTSIVATQQFGSDEQYIWSFIDPLSFSVNMTGSSVVYVFKSEGRYSVVLTVQNDVSNETISQEIIAQHSVKNVSIIQNSSIAEVNQNVTLYVEYTGSNVSFSWNCSSPSNAVSRKTSNEIIVSFSSSGYHECQATLSNMVSSETETITVPILDHISSLSIQHSLINDSFGHLFAVKGDSNSFHLQCNTAFLVDFKWDVLLINLILGSGHGESFNHTFSSPGQYTVRLRAQNSISTVEEVITVSVHDKITQPYLKSNSTSSNIAVGDTLKFELMVGTGTNMVYKWYVDSSIQTDFDSDILVTFTTPGVHVVEGIVSNKVSSETVSANINVYEAVSGVLIVIPSAPTNPAYVKVDEDVEFLSSTTQGSNLTYSWTFTSVYYSHQVPYYGQNVLHQFHKTGLYELKLEVRNNVSSGEDFALVEVQGGLTTLKLLVSDTAISTGSSVTLDANVNPDATNLTYTWIIEGSDHHRKTFSPHFGSSGEKNITLMVENQVSSITKETSIVVFDPILDLIINGCNSVVLAEMELEFVALTSSGSDVVFCWDILVNNKSISEEGPAFKVTFPVEDTYELHVTAKNNVSQLSTACKIKAQLPVENISISVVNAHHEYIFKDKEAQVEVSGFNLEFATFNWALIPASPTIQQITLPATRRINITFDALGDYTLNVTVENDLNRETASLDFNVKQFLCDLPDITRVGSQLHTVQRSQVLELEVAIDPKGCTDYLAIHSWTVYSNQDCSGKKVDIGDTTVSSPALIIKPNVLSTGTYCVHFSTGYWYTPVLESLYYTVTVKASPLRAVIKGGTVRTVVAGESLCLDGQLSYDPDNTSTSILTYQWICTEITAAGGCFQSTFSKTFCYSGFQEKRYNISLVISAPGRQSDVTMQMIDVLNVTDFVPTASIVCQSCSTLANYRISSSQHIALSASCENCQCEPVYSWLVYAGSSNQPLSVKCNDTTTGMDGENLVMKKWGAVKDGMDYTFMVYVRCPSISSNAGTASLTLSTNIPPSGGVCTFSPTQITPLEDQVYVSCVNWFDSDDPDTLINYQILVDAPSSSLANAETQTYVLYYGTDATQSVYLGTYTGDSVKLRVLVSDEFGASVLGGESTINFLPQATSTGKASTTNYLMNQTDNVLSALIKQASPIPLMQYAIAMGQMLNSEAQLDHITHEAGSGSDEEQSRAAIRDAITISLTASFPISTISDVRQMAYAMRVLTGEKTEYLTEGSQILIVQTLEKMATILQRQNNIGMDRNDIPTEDLLVVIDNILSATNARIYSTQQVWQSGRNISLDTFSTDFRSLRPEITDVVEELDFLDVSLDDKHRQSVASTAVPLLESVLVSVLKAMMVEEDDIEVDLDSLKVNAGRSYAENIDLESVSSDSQISLVPSILADVTQARDEVFQVMVSHKNNPYTYGHSTSAQLTMPVQTLTFYNTNGTSMKIQHLQEDSRPTMYMMDGKHNITKPIVAGLLNESDAYDPVINDGSQKSTIIETRAIKIWQVPDAATHVSDGGALHLQVRIVFLPNATHNTNIGSSVSVWLGVGFSPSESRHDQALSITPQDMQDGADHRKYTFAVRGLASTDRIFIQAKNQDNYHDVNLSIAGYYSACHYFDESSQSWATEGCQSLDESIWAVTVCQCNHLTSFGGSSLVSIADIHFADLEELDLSTNPVVFIACACIFVIYLFVVVICRYLDKLDLQRISRIPLCGRDGAFKYEIAIVTGRKFKSGTTSHVGIKLYGDSNKGDARHLTKPGAFQRNCRDTFMIAHDVDLGNVTKVLIWHDNTGLQPSWYLSYIEVKDVQSGLTYTFLVNSWLSLELKDGVIQKTVKVADDEELKKSKLTFQSIFSRKLGDLHTWMSVSDRPDHSRFLRVQRATCCLTSVYLYMCVNAIWYGVLKDQRDADQPVSWSSFGWEEVVIALVSTMIVLPVLVAISMLFKKTRCKESMFQEVLRPSTAQTIEIEAMCDMSRDGTSYRTMTPIDDWIPAIDRESTTDSMAAPSGLKRTVPLHGLQRKDHLRPPGKRELWNKDNIMQSWPHKMPTWIKEVKADFKDQRSGASHSKWQDDDVEDLDEKLDEISAQISRDEEKQKKRKVLQDNSRKNSSADIELFDSDDEWVNEDLEHVQKDSVKPTSKTSKFNPRSEPQLFPNLDRKHSRISTTSSMNTSLNENNGPTTNGTINSRNTTHHGILSRDDSRPSIMSISKPRSALHSRGDPPGYDSLSHHSQHSQSKNSFSFPPWCVYIGYAVCMKLCLLSVIMILLYGYQFGETTALKWLLSLFVSLLLSFFIIEPLKVLVFALIVALVTKDVRDDESDVIDVEPKFESNEQIKDVKFKPLGGFALLQAKEEGKKKQLLYTMLRELIVFAFMVAVFMAGVYVNFSSQSIYYTNDNIQNKFYQNSSDGLNFHKLISIPEYWNISKEVLARGVHLQEVDSTESFGFLMGPAWLRQIRSDEVSCLVESSLAWPSDKRLSSGRCVGGEVEDPETRAYATGWNTPASAAAANYTFSSMDQLDLFSKFGHWLLYSGGGYVQLLGQTYNDTMTTLQSLETDEWVDLKTRAVFLELTLYQPSNDLTSCVTLLAEFPTSGGVLTSITVTTERLLRFISGTVSSLMVCQIMFFPFAIYLLVNLILSMKQEGIRYFSHIWCWIDFAICILAWTCIALYITCVVMATEAVDDFVTNTSNPAHLFLVVKLHSILRYVQASLLFLFLLKVVKQIRFSRPLYKFHMAFNMAAIPLLRVYLIFTALFLIHAQLAHLLYGSVVYGYQGFHNTITSLFGVICGTTDFWPLFESHRVLTHIVFLSFGVFVYGLAVALTVAVLTSSYKWSRAQMCFKTTLEARDYEMIDFMIKRFKVVAGIEKPKPAFRHVKFEGLPSLPSRGTSSNLSSRQSSAEPRPSRSLEPANQTQNQNQNKNQTQSQNQSQQEAKDSQNLDYLMASLLPTWNQVSQSFQKVEDLEKQEEDLIRCLQDVVKCWRNHSPKNRDGLQMKAPAPIMGKPPLDPKAKFLRLHEGSKGRKPTVIAGRPSMTPPSTFTADGSINSQFRRPFSDQGVRSLPLTTDPQISTVSQNYSTIIGGGQIPTVHQNGNHSSVTPRLTKGKMVIEVHPMSDGPRGRTDEARKKKKMRRAWESGV